MDQETKLVIVELWETGLSSTEIGKKLNITRGSVMGVIHRLRANGEKISRRKVYVVKVEAVKPTAKKIGPPKIKSKPLKEEAPPMVLFGTNCTFIDLTPYSCKYIIGPVNGLQTVYCGERKVGRSFCKEHHELCYYPIKRTESAKPAP